MVEDRYNKLAELADEVVRNKNNASSINSAFSELLKFILDNFSPCSFPKGIGYTSKLNKSLPQIFQDGLVDDNSLRDMPKKWLGWKLVNEIMSPNYQNCACIRPLGMPEWTRFVGRIEYETDPDYESFEKKQFHLSMIQQRINEINAALHAARRDGVYVAIGIERKMEDKFAFDEVVFQQE